MVRSTSTSDHSSCCRATRMPITSPWRLSAPASPVTSSRGWSPEAGPESLVPDAGAPRLHLAAMALVLESTALRSPARAGRHPRSRWHGHPVDQGLQAFERIGEIAFARAKALRLDD